MEQKKSNGTGRLRPIELSFQPVFDIHLNMAIDYEIQDIDKAIEDILKSYEKENLKEEKLGIMSKLSKVNGEEKKELENRLSEIIIKLVKMK